MPRNALYVEISDDDLAVAAKQDKWGCAIVCALQRRYPNALRVAVDERHISLSMPDDDTRYTFETPAEVREHVIKPFDLGQPIDPEWRSFTIDHAIEAKPMTHNPERNRAERNRIRRKRPTQNQPTKNPNARSYGRFLDEEVSE